MIKSFEALVLHKQWSGDTSAYVSFFTRELGLIRCHFKGGRTPKKQALLQLFTPLWLSVNERHNRYYVQSLECLHPTVALTDHSLISGFYVNELLYHTLSPNEPEPHLFEAYLFTLNALSKATQKQSLEPILRRFEWTLLKTNGYSFSLTHEAETGILVREDENYRFVAGKGFVPYNQGIPGAHIIALADDNLSQPEYLHSAKFIMRQAIDHLLGGREIKARSLWK